MRQPVILPGRGGLLESLLRSVEDPATRMIALTGPAGVGKSRLLEALEEGLSPNTLVLSHVCRQRDSVRGSAMGGLLERLGRLLTPVRLLGLYEEPGLRRLFALSPALLGRLDAAETGPGQFQFMPVLESLVTLLGRLSQDRALVLALDDLQFIDETSRSLLEGLMAHPALEELGVTLLVSCRDLKALPFASDWQQLLGDFPGLVRVNVEPLDLPGMVELLGSELDPEASRSLSPLAERLLEDSGGLPFLAVLLIRHARRSGLVRATLDGWRLGSLDELSRQLRGGLVDALLSPVLEQQPAARFLLTWLRAAAMPVSLEPLCRAAPARAESWEPLAQELQRLGVLRYETDDQGLLRWGFAHALWVELSGEWLEPADRGEFLRRLAGCLDESDEDQRVLQAELLSRLCRESADPAARSHVVGLLRTILAESSQNEHTLNLQLRLARELAELSDSREDQSLAFRTAVEASMQISAVPILLEWLERAELERLDSPARLVVLENMQRRFILRNRQQELPGWIEETLARTDLEDAERGALLLSLLQWRYSCTQWDGAEEDFARLDALNLLPEQVTWGAVLRCLAAPTGGRSARERLEDLDRLLKEHGELLKPQQQVAVFHEMNNLARLCAMTPLVKLWNDHMVEQARQVGSMGVVRHRDYLARTLTLAGRIDEAELLLSSNLNHFLRRRNWILAAESGLFLLNLMRRTRRLGECAALSDTLTPLLEQPATTYGLKAVRLTACSSYWRVYRTADAARLLEGCEACMVDERAEELQLALRYSRANVRVQQAECGGDWLAAAEACQAMVELYQGWGRQDTEVLIFCVLRDRALSHVHGSSPTRRAADFLPAVALAQERNEYDLVRFQVLIGELALLSGETEVVEAVLANLEDAKHDAALAASFRLACAQQRGHAQDASGALLEVALQVAIRPGEELLAHLLRRWPGLRAWPLPADCPPRRLCLWAWGLANLLEQARPLRLPGLEIADSDRSSFAKAQLLVLRARQRGLEPDDRERLDRELERLEIWLSGQEERATGQGLRLQVLGPVRLLLDDKELDPATLKTRVGVELLALLAIRAWQGRERLSRDEILDALTVDGRPLLSESSLRVVISRLRKALQAQSPEAIRYQERQGYAVAEDLGLSVDALDFERAWTRAQDAQRQGRPLEAERHLDDCLGLYRGAFLPGGASWSDPLRGYFERRFMDAARQRLALLEGQDALRAEFLSRLRARLPELAEFLAVEA